MSKTISPLLHLIFNETISSEREAYKMETEALEYHTRAMASDGIIELEKIYQT
jgi:hypothetical protein